MNRSVPNTPQDTPKGPLVAIIDYGIGNLHSAQKGFQRAGARALLTSDRGLIRDADAVVLPGVGAFASCMAALRRTGLDEVSLEAIDSQRPFMGICVGMQMLFAESEETAGVSGLGVFKESVRWLPETVKRPQMQWNVLQRRRSHQMLEGLQDPIWVYFVHSLSPDMNFDHEDVVATCQYGATVVAAVARRNVWAAQFHPEKSSRVGLQILANFVQAAAQYDTADHAAAVH